MKFKGIAKSVPVLVQNGRVAMVDLVAYGIFFVIIGLIGWRLRQRRARIGSAATGLVYDLLNEDRRKAVEIIVEEKAGARDLEHEDDIVP